MNRFLFSAAFLLGVIVVAWVASSFVGSNTLALVITLVIGCVYTIGFVELLKFRQATSMLSLALQHKSLSNLEQNTGLDRWLDKLDPSLRNSVRLRIEGERVGLPAPVITPYLVGLLVMLGLLGTFAGMVETLKGAVFALEGTTELQAIRAGLTAPIKGLSLAFGTSVAGVATSAMLGLLSTLCRRDRMLATRQLDSKIATQLRSYSLIHNRQETYKALQMQAQALPQVAQKLEAMAEKLERMGDKLGDSLISNQDLFHQSVKTMYLELANSVDQSLRQSMTESGRLAGEGINPMVKEAMAAISQEAENTHQQLSLAVRQQLDEMSGRFGDTTEQVTHAWQVGLNSHERANESLIAGMRESLDAFSGQFETTSTSMLEAFDNRSSTWLERQQTSEQQRLEHWTSSLGQAQQQAATQLLDASKIWTGELKQVTDTQQAAFKTATQDFESLSSALTTQWLHASTRIDELTATLGSELSALRAEEEQRGQAAIARLGDLESTVATHLASLGKELEQPMTRLIQTASETPRAAAEVIGDLRKEISNTLERDNSLLEERRRIMEELNTLSSSLQQASTGQREAIDSLVSSSGALMQDVATQFTDHIASELSTISGVAENFAGSATEMSSLGEAFGVAVQLFNESNGKLVASLNRIEESMDKSTSRSDEQMGYYVAQAREIIDHSMSSQREIFEELRQLSHKEEPVADEVS